MSEAQTQATAGGSAPADKGTTPSNAGASGSAPPHSFMAMLDSLEKICLPRHRHPHPPIKNANTVQQQSLTPLEKAAIAVTDKVGSMGFFLIILTWTVLWCGYNILASEVPFLHWKAFDPFPAFVAYLLISNVIQILLMPLIMVGQNLQGRHSEIRAELDFEINQKAEKEVEMILQRLDQNTALTLQLVKHLNIEIAGMAEAR